MALSSPRGRRRTDGGHLANEAITAKLSSASSGQDNREPIPQVQVDHLESLFCYCTRAFFQRLLASMSNVTLVDEVSQV